MNYRHAFHAGNHADVLKHVALLALCEALRAKPAACFALDTHAGRGLYRLDAEAAQRTGEAEGGIARLGASHDPNIARYLAAIQACCVAYGPQAYPGSPWLLTHALREQDRIACCELQPDEAALLKHVFRDDPRVMVQARDGYAGMKALLPPRSGEVRFARGLVLIDPPYEAQLEEFDHAIAALRDAMTRWPQAMYALWYPIKLRRALQPVYRRFAAIEAKSALAIELLVRPDDSPLRMNGSGLLVLNAPWQFDTQFKPTLRALQNALQEPEGGDARIEWLRAPA